jgi:uncharacterized protein with von Willebrand factor type A (vWA) domain
VSQEVLARAAAERPAALLELDPERVQPSVELLEQILALRGGLAEAQLGQLRRLVERCVGELVAELALRLEPALGGLATPHPERRPVGPLNLARTVARNLHTLRSVDGQQRLVPERLIFRRRARRSLDWRLILVVDVSGSMQPSVIYSALVAAILARLPALSLHFLTFSTRVVDLSQRVDDRLALLLEVEVGGGTHIARALRYAQTLVTVPARTMVVLVTDFEEGGPLAHLLDEVRGLADAGTRPLGLAALDDAGQPRYCVAVAEQVAAAGMPVAALTPLELARWVGQQLRS